MAEEPRPQRLRYRRQRRGAALPPQCETEEICIEPDVFGVALAATEPFMRELPVSLPLPAVLVVLARDGAASSSLLDVIYRGGTANLHSRLSEASA